MPTRPIADYHKKAAHLEQAFLEQCQANQWGMRFGRNIPIEAVLAHGQVQLDSLKVCFPGLDIRNIDSVDTAGKLWAYLIVGPTYREPKRWCEADLLAVYGVLHRLGVAWAPVPPYTVLKGNEIQDMLMWIANRLERDE